jgi:hypothetical protein
MTTHRSLNKLERKAHMSLHTLKEVGDEGEPAASPAFTHDRFGKKHSVKNPGDADETR